MHGAFQRRLLREYEGTHALRKRVAQVGNTLDDDASDSGINLLYPNGPITITVTRTIAPATLQGNPIYPNVPAQNQNYEAPHQTYSTLVSTDTTPSPSTTVGTLGTSTPRNSPGADLNNPQPPARSSGVSNANGTELSSGSSKPVPSGVVIGVVILCIFLAFGVIVFVVRRRYVRRRQRLRKGWTNSKPARLSGPTSATHSSQPEPKISFASTDPPTMLINTSRIPLAAAAGINPTSAATPSVPTPRSSIGNVNPVLAAPPASYGNETPYTQKQAGSSTPIYGPPTTTVLSQPIATVVSTFITTLPDEIAITIGEAIRVLAEYDDGWALCVNSRGEKGMIPMECLDGRYSAAANDSSDMSRGAGGNRRRVSSLQPIVGNVGRF